MCLHLAIPSQRAMQNCESSICSCFDINSIKNSWWTARYFYWWKVGRNSITVGNGNSKSDWRAERIEAIAFFVKHLPPKPLKRSKNLCLTIKVSLLFLGYFVYILSRHLQLMLCLNHVNRMCFLKFALNCGNSREDSFQKRKQIFLDLVVRFRRLISYAASVLLHHTLTVFQRRFHLEKLSVTITEQYRFPALETRMSDYETVVVSLQKRFGI